MDCFLYDIGLRHERVKLLEFIQSVGGPHMHAVVVRVLVGKFPPVALFSFGSVIHVGN